MERDFLNMASYFLDVNIWEGREGRIALRYGERTYTYSEISILTNKVGNILKDLGVQAENRIYIVLNDCPELVAAFYGTIKIGAVATLAYTYLKPDDYWRELSYIKPNVIVMDGIALENIRAATKSLRKAPCILVVDGSNLSDGEYNLRELLEHASEHLDPEPTHKYDPCLWKFSGGTTGVRKAVSHCHADAVYAYESYRQIVKYTQDDIILSIPKMFFGYGRDGTIVFPFRVGASAVLYPDRAVPQRIFDLVRQHKPTILVNVPTAIRQMLEVPKEIRPDFNSIRLCISSGEALSAQLYKAWKENFVCEIIDGIGSAEMYYVYISNRPGDIVEGSLGKPTPGYEARIVSDEGLELSHGEIGILAARGGSAGIGYVRDPEKTRKTFRGEWIYTDDLFYKDKEGNFYFAGRGDDLLKVSGYFVSPLEIERCIEGHPDVLECAVVGIVDQDGLVKTKAHVVLKPGILETEEKATEIQLFPKEKLSPYKYPRFIEFRKELPKTSLGKLDRKKLQRETKDIREKA